MSTVEVTRCPGCCEYFQTQSGHFCSRPTIAMGSVDSDPVNPSHYVKRGIEVRHVIRAFECSYNIGTAVAYLLRAPFKKDYIEDLRKAAMHIQFELEDRGSEATKTTTKGIP